MRQSLALILVAALAGSITAPTFAKTPQPSIYPISWQLDFKHGSPKRVVVGTDAYWYLTYTVTNNTGDEQVFRPDFEMLNKEGKVLKSDRAIPAEVFDKIKSVEGNRLLQPLSKVAGALRQGVDQAKDGVAIWPEVTRAWAASRSSSAASVASTPF